MLDAKEIELDITTVSVTKEYRVSHDYNSVSGTVGATATVRAGQDPDAVEEALAKRVGKWLAADYEKGCKLVARVEADPDEVARRRKRATDRAVGR